MKTFSRLSIPYLIWLAMMVLLPMLLIAFYSVTDSGNGIISFTFTFDHFIKFFTDRDFLLILWRSLVIAVKTTVICVILGYPVAYFIARHLKSNVRELEGALNCVIAFARFNHQEKLTVEKAREALQNILVASTAQLTVERIQGVVAEYFKISLFIFSSI